MDGREYVFVVKNLHGIVDTLQTVVYTDGDVAALSEEQRKGDVETTKMPILRSIGTGIFSYMASLAITYAIIASTIDEFLSYSGVGIDFSRLEGMIGGHNMPSQLQISIWFQDRALRTQHVIVAESIGGDGSRVFDVTNTPIWTDSIYLIAPAVILGMGYLAVTLRNVKDISQIIKFAILSSAGFAVSAFAASFYSIWSINMGIAAVGIGPEGGSEYLMTLVLLPLSLTAVGGLIAHTTNT